jgi:hypothetical protein
MVMVDELDQLLEKQRKEYLKLKNSTFWSRNKRLIISISVILLVLWICSVSYAFYGISRVYDMTQGLKTNRSQ